jgi:hypothetical protein
MSNHVFLELHADELLQRRRAEARQARLVMETRRPRPRVGGRTYLGAIAAWVHERPTPAAAGWWDKVRYWTMELLIWLVGLVGLALAAQRWGYDSRPGPGDDRGRREPAPPLPRRRRDSTSPTPAPPRTARAEDFVVLVRAAPEQEKAARIPASRPCLDPRCSKLERRVGRP